MESALLFALKRLAQLGDVKLIGNDQGNFDYIEYGGKKERYDYYCIEEAIIDASYKFTAQKAIAENRKSIGS